MLIESFKQNGKTIEIHTDESPESPREWDNLGTLVCFHKRYVLGDTTEHGYRSEYFDGWTELERQIKADNNPAVILPLFLFDHSGLTISTESESFRAADSMGWDWGQIGFIFCSTEKALEEFGSEMTPEIEGKVKEHLVSEVKVYDQYLKGEVYGYIVKDATGEEEDSCWGFYGLDYAKNEAKHSTDSLEVGGC